MSHAVPPPLAAVVTYDAPSPSWFLIAAGLVAVLLVVGPLIAAIVLAVRGRWGWAAGAGTLGAVSLLGATFALYVSVRQTHVDQTYIDQMSAAAEGRLDESHFNMQSAAWQSDDPWHDAARRHDARIQEQDRRDRARRSLERRSLERRGLQHRSDGAGNAPVRRPVQAPVELVAEDALPAWVTTVPADRLVVSGPRVTDEDGGPAAAQRAAETRVAAALADAAGLPAAAITPDDVTRPGTIRRAAVQTRTLTTGENAFTVYQGHLLVDASPSMLDHLRRGYRDRLGRERAAWAAGAGGLCVVCFAGLWGLGRRKLAV